MHTYVSIIGNLTKGVELHSATGVASVGSSAIASTRKFTVNGEKREETCFIDIVLFGKNAEIAQQYLHKGSKLFIEGRLKFSQWIDANGQNRSKHSVVVDKMVMLDKKENEQETETDELKEAANETDKLEEVTSDEPTTQGGQNL